MFGRLLSHPLLKIVVGRAACAVRTLLVTLIFASAIACQANADNVSCNSLPRYIAKELPKNGCTCGPLLRNLKFTPPTGMNLVAACGLQWASMNREIDLRRESVSLDAFTDGDLPYGIIYLDGSGVRAGNALVEPMNSGELWFHPKPGFSNRGLPLGDQMSELKFSSNSDYAAFRVNEKVLNSDCSSARARIRIRGLRIVIGETDEAGSYPLVTRVLKISKYKDCKAN